METSNPIPADEPYRRVTTVVSLLLIVVGTLVLTGWALDLFVLQGLGGSITMKANAALGLVAAGLALGLRTLPAAAHRPGRLFALLAGAIGALTFSEHIIGWNLGIDELMFRESPGAAATTSPGRMGPNASLSLTLAAIGIWWLYDGHPRAVGRAQIIGACIAVFALVPTVGYLYGATQLYAVARFTGIAVHTGVALLALGIGILATRADGGPVAALMTAAPHGLMARRLLALSVLFLVVLGYARIAGERRGWFDSGFGTAVFVVAMIVFIAVATWQATLALGRSEHARQQTQRERDTLLVRDRERAERADRAKDEFIAALSHELRTPINAIAGWTQMLQKEAVAEGTRAKALGAVSRNSAALTRLIDDLLETSRIATGHLELSRAAVDVNAVVHAAVDSITPMAATRNVGVTTEPDPAMPTVIGDGQRLQQVLWNVLSNAVKFSPPQSTVRVQVAGDGHDVVVRIQDDGEGIDPVFLPRVFEQFQQGAMASRGQGSLGLGLHIAKYLVERHGGSIQAQSDGRGLGSVFTVRLPRVETSAAQMSAERSV